MLESYAGNVSKGSLTAMAPQVSCKGRSGNSRQGLARWKSEESSEEIDNRGLDFLSEGAEGWSIREEYFRTTYKFIDISPNALIPMHGRLNLWPKHMLCGYLKNRRSRESVILKAIENGAKTLFDIVAYTYADVDRSLWGHAASNVRLHVDHLAKQEKLPKDFSLQKFQTTCGLRFLSYWASAYLSSFFLPKHPTLRTPAMLGAVAVVGFAMAYSIKHKPHSE